MEKITAIIIDDEINARENIRYLVDRFCPNVSILDEASNIDEAVLSIEKNKPQFIFLDIEMPQKNGFQLLNHFKKIDFHIIFITAYDQYAIRAFKVSAVDYLLKPIDIDELKKAVQKVSILIKTKSKNTQIELLKENQKKIKKIAIPYKSDYVIIDVTEIAFIKADRMYSVVHLLNGKKYTASKKLSYYEDLLTKQEDFVRVHRSWLINANFIFIYSKKDKTIELTDGSIIPLSKSYKDIFEELFSKS